MIKCLEEIEEAVRKLKDRKNPCIDGIPAELIKTEGPALITEIHRICNMTGRRVARTVDKINSCHHTVYLRKEI